MSSILDSLYYALRNSYRLTKEDLRDLLKVKLCGVTPK